MSLFRLIVAGLFGLILFTSCRSTKKISQAVVKKDTTAMVVTMPPKEDTAKLVKDLLDNMNTRRIQYSTFSAKIKVDYWNSKGKQPDFVANIRMKKDSLIWISLSSDLGIEGIRVLITPDSVKFLDKLANTYTRRPLSFIQEVSQIPFAFADLQDLLVGNPVFFNSDSITSYSRSINGFSILSVDSLFKNLVTINLNYNIEKSKLDDVDKTLNRTCDIVNTEYENKTGTWFSTFREISVSQQTKLDIQMKFKDYEFNKELNFPFTVPKRFKRL
jgi:hypothetical protein